MSILYFLNFLVCLPNMTSDSKFPPTPRIKIFRNKMSLVCQKDKIKLDAWTCKSMLSFIKMKTHKNLGSADSRLDLLSHVGSSVCFWGYAF